MAHINPMQVQRFISSVNYPAEKEQIVSSATSEGVDSTVVSLLGKLPRKTYRTPAAVNKAIDDLQ